VIDRDDTLSDAQLSLLADGEATAEGERQAGGQVSDRAAGDQSKLDQELSLALENLDKSNRENQELRTRLEALEEQINTLQRLINLKDEQMVALQTGMTDTAAAETGSAAEMQPETEMASADQTAPTAKDTTDLNFGGEPAGDSAADPMQKDATEAVPAEPADQPKKPLAPKALPPVPQPKGPMDFVMENLPLVGGGLLAILLALLGLRAVKNRKSEDDAEKESAFLAETMDDLTDHPMDGSADSLDDDFADLELGDEVVDGGVPDMAGDALDMSGSGDAGLPDALDEHHESSDVLGEADMYMAYGRLDRAKDLLETTLLTEPGRIDLKVKLLEVLAEQDDAVAFAEQFESVMAEGDDEQKETANRLRQNLSNPEAGAENELVLDSDLSGGEELDFSEFETEDLGLPEETADLDLTDEGNELDFDLDALEMDAGDSPVTESAPELAEADENSLDFELNLDSDDGLGSELDETPLDLDLDDSDGEMSLDFDLDEVDAELPTLDSDLAESDSLETLDVGDDLNDLSFEGDLDNAAGSDKLPTLDLGEDNSLELDQDLDLDQEMDLTLDTGSDDLAELEALESELDTELADLDADLDLDLDASELSEEGAEDVSLAELEAELDDEITLDVDSDELELPEFDADEELSLDSLDADLDLAEAELSGSDLDLSEGDLDLTLDNELEVPELAPELDVDAAAENVEAPQLEPATEDVPELAAEANTEVANAAEPTEEPGDLNLDDLDDDLDFLSGTDESETKLDLARAYIDMDDKDGAREILSEVIEEGNDEQRQEANKLMDSLS